MSIQVKAVGDALKRAEKYLSHIPGGTERAVSSAMNRAMTQARTVAVRSATSEYDIKARDVRQTFTIKRSSKGNLSASLTSKGRNLPLNRFKYRPKTDTTGAKRRPIAVSVKRSTGMKPLRTGFIWDGKVMQRVGRKLMRPSGIAVPVMLNNQAVSDAVTEKMQEVFVRRTDHEIMRLLK